MKDECSWKLNLSASSAESGEPVQLYFTDAQYGGEKASLAAAQITREALRDRKRKLGHRKTTVRTAKRLLPAGVTRLIDRRLDAQGHPRYDLIWVAYWMEPGEGDRMRQAKRCFSVRAHGYEKAFVKARNLRAKKSGFDIGWHPCPSISDILAEEDDAQMIISQVTSPAGGTFSKCATLSHQLEEKRKSHGTHSRHQ